MIRVVRLTGESYDLESGLELPKALVLSNGIREFSLHVDDSTAMAVVQMMAEDHNRPVEATPVGTPVETPVETLAEKAPGNGSPPRLQEVWEGSPYDDTPVDEAPREEELEPGEEYNDPATGVGSL